MPVNKEAYQKITGELHLKNVTLVAVSKTSPAEDIKALYDLGQRDFGENYVQELEEKAEQLPKDIRWHYIGHLQSNKVKTIASYVHLIHGVDSLKLLQEINKQALKNNRVIDCLLQIYIAKEETKFGLDESDFQELIDQSTNQPVNNVRICGLMGMASFTENMDTARSEFRYLKKLYDKQAQFPIPDSESLIPHSQFTTLSMGMSSDYQIAIEEGSTIVRIGSLLFGPRNP